MSLSKRTMYSSTISPAARAAHESGVPLPRGGMLARLKRGEMFAQLDEALASIGFEKVVGGTVKRPTD